MVGSRALAQLNSISYRMPIDRLTIDVTVEACVIITRKAVLTTRRPTFDVFDICLGPGEGGLLTPRLGLMTGGALLGTCSDLHIRFHLWSFCIR